MKLLIGLLAMLLPILSGAQSPPVRALSVGDTVPDVVFNHVINYKDTTARLSDFKEKLVILDFMSTGCAPCIRELPRLDSIQNQYSNKVVTFIVTQESEKRMNSFFKNRKSINIPAIYNDSLLHELFPHIFISHFVVIKDGIVKAITFPEYITFKSIKKSINENNFDWPLKIDRPDFDFGMPLIVQNNSLSSDLVPLYYSAVLKYMPGVLRNILITQDSSANQTVYKYVNFSLLDLITQLFDKIRLPKSYMFLDSISKRIMGLDRTDQYSDNWSKEHLYCFELKMPFNIADYKKKLISDINFNFKINSKIEKRQIDCMILKNDSSVLVSDKLNGKEGLRLGMIVYLLNENLGNAPVIDETIGKSLAKIPFDPEQVFDQEYLQNKLLESGIKILKEKRELEVLVISHPSANQANL